MTYSTLVGSHVPTEKRLLLKERLQSMDSGIDKIYERVRTWSALDPHDIPIIQKSSIDKDVQLHALDSRIASLRAELDALEKRRSKLCKLSNGYHTLLSPNTLSSH